MTGFERCLEPIMKKYGDEKVFYWANLRQEPVVYVNDKPYSARDPKALHQHIMISNPEEVNKMEAEFIEEIQKRGADFKYFQDVFGDIPDDRSAKLEEKTEKLEKATTLSNIFGALKEKGDDTVFGKYVSKVEALRILFAQDKAPEEQVFDQILAILKNTSASTPIVFNCQAGISRTTTAMVIASLIKEFQLVSELNHMKGIVPDDILELLEKYQANNQGKIAKAQVDKLIDLAAPPPKGTGVQNIRECIIQDKMTFAVSADEWQAYLKEKIMNNIERYFYLIVFAMYVREVGPQDYNKTFKQWMDDNGHLREMIAEGRSKLEWERKIPDEKLVDLKDMLNSDDFKTHLPKVIKRIYELAWEQFSDLPRGHHKNSSMHKLASKTMIEILPEKLMSYIESKCGSLASTPDFFDVIGQVSWYETEAPPKKE